MFLKPTKQNTRPIFMLNPERFQGSLLYEFEYQLQLSLCLCPLSRKMPLAEGDFAVFLNQNKLGNKLLFVTMSNSTQHV